MTTLESWPWFWTPHVLLAWWPVANQRRGGSQSQAEASWYMLIQCRAQIWWKVLIWKGGCGANSFFPSSNGMLVTTKRMPYYLVQINSWEARNLNRYSYQIPQFWIQKRTASWDKRFFWRNWFFWRCQLSAKVYLLSMDRATFKRITGEHSPESQCDKQAVYQMQLFVKQIPAAPTDSGALHGYLEANKSRYDWVLHCSQKTSRNGCPQMAL